MSQEEEEDEDEVVEASKFSQQTMDGTLPQMSSFELSVIFMVAFVILLVLGFPTYITSVNLYESVNYYNSTYNITINVPKRVKGPVYVMYQLEDVYQNHRRWVQSRDYDQLSGKKIQSSALKSCDPRNKDLINNTIPCGIAAASFFTDKYNLTFDGKEIPFSEKNLVSKAEKSKYKSQSDEDFDYANDERFIAWMKGAALPTFRKIYGTIEDDLVEGDYIMEVEKKYNLTDGRRAIVLSKHGWIGGRNDFAGIFTIAIAGVCLLIAVLLMVKGVFFKRKF